MAQWPRTILPQAVSPLMLGGALASWGDTGKPQHRATGQLGVFWQETLRPFEAGSVSGRALLAFILNHWRNGLTFDIDHRQHQTHLGGGTGTARVNGASQTGSTLNTDGWTGSNPVLRTGDIVTISGVSGVRLLTADAPNLSAGAAALSITPPIFAGASPADNAVITYTGVLIPARLAAPPDIPAAGPDTFIGGLTLTFREAIV